jgi:hypothetical protein
VCVHLRVYSGRLEEWGMTVGISKGVLRWGMFGNNFWEEDEEHSSMIAGGRYQY